MTHAQRQAVARPADSAFRLIVESHPAAILVVGADGRIVYGNQEAVQMLGYSGAELQRLSVDELVPEGVSRRHEGHRASYAGQPAARSMGAGLDLHARRKDGSLVPVDVGLRSFSHDGERYVIAAIVDNTDQRAERELRERFIDVLSHELRTPVTTLFAGAVVLHERQASLSDDVVRELTEQMAGEADRLQRIVENLLVLARVERGVPIDATEPILLQRMLPELAARERRIMTTTTPVTVSVHPDTPIVRGHEESVALILHNLLSNAAKYGGGSPIEVEASGAGDLVEICVGDRGPGLGAHELDLIFDMYHRSTATERIAPGSGIGLFVARALATAMGGGLRAVNRPRGGARFVLTLATYDGRGASAR